ncbi:MAG: N-acetyl-gamma-glutamyl-phosphate reductase [Elusimicrobiota bacterium]|nr:N-acetyl-gamma-glutamyl-phosphate reductase [Elusimicrobiota bacterium]
MFKASIIGISGYTGEELLKILSKHKYIEIAGLYGRADSAVRDLKDFYPSYAGLNLKIKPLDLAEISKLSDIVFLALPHSASFPIVGRLLDAGVKIIDLSADFRIKNADVYEKWYGIKHSALQYLPEAVYGLSELNFEKIKTARLIANPGCYPTSILLACAPASKNFLVDFSDIAIDAQSGISGAGRKAAKDYFENEHPNARAYKAGGTHRHIPEIEQELSAMTGKKETISFTPHIIPMERGMLSTIYLNLKKKISEAQVVEMYKEFYKSQPFIKILEVGKLSNVKSVINTNFCEISIKIDERTNKLLVFSAIDNLGKGAAGQAAQNMNIVFGLKQDEGLLTQ